jgi:ElaA protein
VSTPEAIQAARFADLDPATLYALLRLRVNVFVVEQHCPYPELDGRDLEPATLHLWLEQAGAPTAYLRILAEPDGTARIGRVVVAPAHRGRGLARRLLAEALARLPGRPCVLDAQSHLVDFYAEFGFTSVGDEFLEDGIPHISMRRGA